MHGNITIKKFFSLISLAFVLLYLILPAFAAEYTADVNAKSAILIEASTGKIIFEKNADEALPPASVTKIMSLLLVMEAIDSGRLNYTDMVSVSAHAASMGGSQVYLKEGESMSVDELIKCVVVASANDATVALAEHVAGSEEAFVAKMNARAEELGMKNTHFENTNGLDDSVTNHLTSARDIAIMSRELISHEKILEYSSIWMDTIRDGAFGLTNTNRLIRFYKGANGLKTGSTSKALFCMSATALRDGMQLIAVIMGAPTRDIRNEEAKKLLDFGFANYSVLNKEGGTLPNIKVLGGTKEDCSLSYPGFSALLNKGEDLKIETKTELPVSINAPVKAGDMIGTVSYYCGDKKVGEVGITATETVEKISFGELFLRMLQRFFTP